jgi:hypothetical protein
MVIIHRTGKFLNARGVLALPITSGLTLWFPIELVQAKKVIRCFSVFRPGAVFSGDSKLRTDAGKRIKGA